MIGYSFFSAPLQKMLIQYWIQVIKNYKEAKTKISDSVSLTPKKII